MGVGILGSKEKLVSISKVGNIGLSAPVVELYFKGKRYVELYYDPKGKRIGLRPLDKKSPDALTIRYDKKGRVGQVIARGFLKAFNINIEGIQKYVGKWISRTNMLVINLTSPFKTIKSLSGRKRR